MVDNGPVEPAAGARQAAHAIREIYLALMQEGFTERQALVIVGQAIAAANQNGEQ
jgi:hypothetical protein